MRSGPYTGGAVLLPWDALDLHVRRKLLRAHAIAAENRRADTRAMLGLAAACGLVLLILSGSGFGQLSHPWIVQSHWFVLTYGLLVAGIVVPSAWLARRIFSRHSWLPFERALLPLDAVEATRKGLIVRPFGDARFASMKHGVFEIAYVDTSTFRIRLDPSVDEAQLLAAETTLERASLTTDDAYRASVDPFHDLRGDKGLRAHPRAIPIEARTAGHARADELATVVMVIAAFALASFLVSLRNRLSDDAAFDYARKENVRVHYEEYTGSGGKRHAREVNEELLPRLVLDDAERLVAPADIARFLERFPHSRFDAEAHAALATACLTVSTGYMKVDLFSDVDRFVYDHPKCAEQRATVSSRFFEATRQTLRAHSTLEPPIRAMLLTLLDRAEAKQERVPFRLVTPAGTVDETQWWLANRISDLGGAVLVTNVGPSNDTEGARLDIALAPVDCALAGQVGVPGAVVASFELSIDGVRQAKWQRNSLEGELFSAITELEEPTTAAVCDKAIQESFHGRHVMPLSPL